MPNNYIDVNTQKRLGSITFGACTGLAESRDRIVQLKNDMDNMVSGTDYTLIETNFGLPTGKGQIFYNLVAGTVAEMAAATNMVNLINWIGVGR